MTALPVRMQTTHMCKTPYLSLHPFTFQTEEEEEEEEHVMPYAIMASYRKGS